MEKIKLITEERVVFINNSLGEVNWEYIGNNEFTFLKGKVYGIICEYGGGGEFISSLLSGNIEQEKEKIIIDESEITDYKNNNVGWYMGAPFIQGKRIKKEISVEKEMCRIMRQNIDFNKNSILETFHLTNDRLNYRLSNYSHEKWRVSMAVGYIRGKKIFCFPWMNSLNFYDVMSISNVYRLFDLITDQGGIILLPTSAIENVKNISDEIIRISEPRFNLHL